MAQKNIALELLVINGNPEGVELLANEQNISNPLKTEKIVEAGVYYAIKKMWEDAEGGIDSQVICPYLSQTKFTEYFNSTKDVNLLGKIVDVLQAGTHAQMEAYAQISAIDVLGIEALEKSIRRNMDNKSLNDKIVKLVKEGYSLVFCPHDIDSDMVNHYFPIVDKWRDLINPQEVAAKSIENIADDSKEEDIFEYDYKKEFVYAALDRLIELTDRETVSQLMYENFGESKNYKNFIADGKIEEYNPKPIKKSDTKVGDKIRKAVNKYENDRYPFSSAVRELSEAIGKNGKDYISERMGAWFREGKIRHLNEIAGFEDGRLYNHDIAKKAIGEEIAELYRKGDLERLESIFDFPPSLIDESNPEISDVVQAYKINQQTKK